MLYAADYGFSDRLSQTLARGVTKAGVATEMVDVLSADPQVCMGGMTSEACQLAAPAGKPSWIDLVCSIVTSSNFTGDCCGRGCLQGRHPDEPAREQRRRTPGENFTLSLGRCLRSSHSAWGAA